jgi:hypothetical protein
MSKTFYYTAIKEVVYLEDSDEYEEFGEDFEYEVEESQLVDAMVNILFREYYGKTEISDYCEYTDIVKKGLKGIIEDSCSIEKLAEDYEDKLKEYFKEDAMEYYDNNY